MTGVPPSKRPFVPGPVGPSAPSVNPFSGSAASSSAAPSAAAASAATSQPSASMPTTSPFGATPPAGVTTGGSRVASISEEMLARALMPKLPTFSGTEEGWATFRYDLHQYLKVVSVEAFLIMLYIEAHPDDRIDDMAGEPSVVKLGFQIHGLLTGVCTDRAKTFVRKVAAQSGWELYRLLLKEFQSNQATRTLLWSSALCARNLLQDGEEGFVRCWEQWTKDIEEFERQSSEVLGDKSKIGVVLLHSPSRLKDLITAKNNPAALTDYKVLVGYIEEWITANKSWSMGNSGIPMEIGAVVQPGQVGAVTKGSGKGAASGAAGSGGKTNKEKEAEKKKKEAEKKKKEEEKKKKEKAAKGNGKGSNQKGSGTQQQQSKPQQQQQQQGKGQQFKGTCNNCGLVGHKAAACTRRPMVQSVQQSPYPTQQNFSQGMQGFTPQQSTAFLSGPFFNQNQNPMSSPVNTMSSGVSTASTMPVNQLYWNPQQTVGSIIEGDCDIPFIMSVALDSHILSISQSGRIAIDTGAALTAIPVSAVPANIRLFRGTDPCARSASGGSLRYYGDVIIRINDLEVLGKVLSVQIPLLSGTDVLNTHGLHLSSLGRMEMVNRETGSTTSIFPASGLIWLDGTPTFSEASAEQSIEWDRQRFRRRNAQAYAIDDSFANPMPVNSSHHHHQHHHPSLSSSMSPSFLSTSSLSVPSQLSSLEEERMMRMRRRRDVE